MNSTLNSCGLKSNPRWIELEFHGAFSKYMCSNCGFTRNYGRLREECPNCKCKMGLPR